MPRAALAMLLLIFAGTVGSKSPPAAPMRGQPPPIQDNSFLMEEAYNQEKGAVQPINTSDRMRGREWLATFTQEWPVPGQAHQLSYTVPFQSVAGEAGRRSGLGDIALNYRYQLAGDSEAKVACAPRLSLLLPTGDEKKGLGSGGIALQTDVAMSTVLSSSFVTHTNLGVTYTPSARNERGERASTRAWNLGQSLVWLAGAVTGADRPRAARSFFVSPGLRWAWNFPTGLQVVPGIAVPIGVGPSRGDRALFLYLSFEHAMWKPAR